MRQLDAVKFSNEYGNANRNKMTVLVTMKNGIVKKLSFLKRRKMQVVINDEMFS